MFSYFVTAAGKQAKTGANKFLFETQFRNLEQRMYIYRTWVLMRFLEPIQCCEGKDNFFCIVPLCSISQFHILLLGKWHKDNLHNINLWKAILMCLLYNVFVGGNSGWKPNRRIHVYVSVYVWDSCGCDVLLERRLCIIEEWEGLRWRRERKREERDYVHQSYSLHHKKMVYAFFTPQKYEQIWINKCQKYYLKLSSREL